MTSEPLLSKLYFRLKTFRTDSSKQLLSGRVRRTQSLQHLKSDLGAPQCQPHSVSGWGCLGPSALHLHLQDFLLDGYGPLSASGGPLPSPAFRKGVEGVWGVIAGEMAYITRRLRTPWHKSFTALPVSTCWWGITDNYKSTELCAPQTPSHRPLSLPTSPHHVPAFGHFGGTFPWVH